MAAAARGGRHLRQERRRPVKYLRWLLSFLLGCCIGVVFHYALYRMGLPVQPFIYMAF
jgi:hypothetical protein